MDIFTNSNEIVLTFLIGAFVPMTFIMYLILKPSPKK